MSSTLILTPKAMTRCPVVCDVLPQRRTLLALLERELVQQVHGARHTALQSGEARNMYKPEGRRHGKRREVENQSESLNILDLSLICFRHPAHGCLDLEDPEPSRPPGHALNSQGLGFRV